MQNIREEINAQVAPVVSYGATNETEEASLVPTPVTAPATKPAAKGWGPNAVVRALALVVVSVLVAVVLVSSNKLTASSSSPDLSKIEVNKDLADAVAMRAPKGNPGIFGAPPQAAPPAPAAPQAGPPTPAAPVAAPQAGPPTPAAPYAPPVEAPKTVKPVVDIGTFKPTVPVADPVPVQVIAARAVVKGCPGSLALSADFLGKFEAAMATEIRIGDASNVKVQDVTMSTDATKKTVFTITYVVKNFNVDLIRSVRNRVESRDTADNVAKVLMQGTCPAKDMSVEPALSAPATVNIATLPVVMGYFTIKNCPSTSVAQTADFQTQFKVAVAAELGGMTSDNVDIVSIDLDTDDGKPSPGSVWITYRLIDLSPSDLNGYKDQLTNRELPKAITDRLANSKCPAAQIPAPPAPTTVTDEVIAMPAPSPPAPTFVMYGQVDIDGCPPQQADSAAFADQVTSTIAQYSKHPVEDVAIIDMSVNDRSQQMTVKYAVANVPDGGVAPLQALLEGKAAAGSMKDMLSRGPCPKASVTDVPVIAATQPMGGVSQAQAQQPSFQDAFIEAVAGRAGVDPNSVTITDVVVDPQGAVSIQYQVADVDPANQIIANAAMESQGLATAIADNLQEAGFRGASAQPAEAAITTVTVTEIPPPVPVKTPVLMGQSKVMGCPAMGDDDQDTFATQFGAAVATELAVDPSNVVITSTRFGDDDGLYVQYIVKNVDDADAKRVEMLLEYPSTAENVGEALSHGPCPKAAVQPAVAGVSTIDIVQAPAVEVAAPMNGVTVDQANAPKFQEAFIEGVAAQMDVKPDQVVVTDVAYGEVAQGPAPVIVTFQIRDIDQDDQLDMTKAAATDDMAGAIQDALADAGYDATPQTPDATMTSVEVIQMPEDVPPAPEAVVEVQATFGGVTTDDAHDADFQEAIRAAVAEALDVDESQVIITDVDTDDEGDVVVTYVVTGMDPADVEEAAATLETREVADAILEQMQDEGYDDVVPGPVNAGDATVEIEEVPVIEAAQPIAGVTPDDAHSDEFQDAFIAAVAEKLDVDEEQVRITDISMSAPDDDNAGPPTVVITYQVSDVDSYDLLATANAMESEGMAAAVADNLQDAGFDDAAADPADTTTFNEEVVDMPDDDVRSVDVLIAQIPVDGVTPAEAESPEFQEAIVEAIVEHLDGAVDEDDVQVVAVEVPRPAEDDSTADLVLTVIIKDVPGLTDDDTDDASPFSNTDDAASADNLQFALTDPALAETITTSLNEAGFDGAEADIAEAGTATLILEETPVVEADLPLSNVSVEDANEPAFQEALIEAVAERLNVDADDVTITAVTAADDDEADVVVTYQVAEVDVMDQMETEKVVESEGLANAIESNLVEAGYRGVDVDVADAEVTSVLTVSMPDDATATEPVIEVVAEVSGVSLDDAQSGDFEDTFEHAVADMLDVPPEQVDIVSVTENEEGDVEVVYVVQGVDADDAQDVLDTLEDPAAADAIAEALNNADDDRISGVSVAPQDAAEATAEVTEVPVIEATSEVAGLTESEVESEAFEVTFEKAVANALDIDPSQVDIVDVRPSDDDSGKYEIVYQITDIEPTAQIAASNAIESDPVAEAVEAELVKAGFDDVDVAAADASVTFEEVIELPEAESDNEVAIVAQQVFVGLTPDDAADETFQEALAAAVAEEVSENTDAEVDPAQVVVTSVTTNSDGETVVSFVVTGLDAEDLAAVSDAVESGPFAEEVTDAVNDLPGLSDIQAEPAQAEEQTVQVIESTLIEVDQDIAGVTVAQASSEEFTEAVEAAVSLRLDVPAENVEVVDVVPNEDGPGVTVTYQVSDVDADTMMATEKAVESEGTATAIEGALADAGYPEASVDAAEAEMTVDVTVTQPDAVDQTVLEVEQQVTGVSEAQAENDVFTTAFTETVADQLDVFASDVIITDISPAGTDSVTVSYTVQNIEETQLADAETSVESASSSQAIGTALIEAGYDGVHVEHAEATASDVQVLTFSAISASQCVSDVTVALASTAAFQASFVSAVETLLDKYSEPQSAVASAVLAATQPKASETHSVVITAIVPCENSDASSGFQAAGNMATVVYEVDGVCPKHTAAIGAVLASSYYAEALSAVLEADGYTGVTAEAAGVDVSSTVSYVVHYTTETYTQSLTGVTAIEAQTSDFKDVFRKAVASTLGGLDAGVDADDVDVLTVDTKASTVTVTFTVKYLEVNASVSKAVQSASSAAAIAAALKKGGYTKVIVKNAVKVAGKAVPADSAAAVTALVPVAPAVPVAPVSKGPGSATGASTGASTGSKVNAGPASKVTTTTATTAEVPPVKVSKAPFTTRVSTRRHQ